MSSIMQAADPGYDDDLVPPQRLAYMPGIDGLRAVAVMAVVLYHADIGWARGGFLGVEVFFVISGYLITSLLLVEWLRTGRIDLRSFWIRRARRLLPAVALLLGVVSVGATLFYRDIAERLVGDVIAAAGYVTNWFLIVREVSYFESFGRPPLLQHLWSLSIEEQFYLVWPVVFAVGIWLLRRRTKKRTIRSFALFTLLGIAASTVLMAVLFVPFEDPSRVYYGTDTRVAGVLVGVLLAFVWIPWRLSTNPGLMKRSAVRGVGWMSLAIVVVALVSMDEFSSFLYRGGFLLTSLATAGVIAATVHPVPVFGRLLSNPVARWIGTRSYGIYLWHWPILMVTRPGVDIADNRWVTFSFRLVLTFLAAELSYQVVEAPIRRLGFIGWLSSWRGLLGNGARRQAAPAMGVALLAIAVGASIVVLSAPGSEATASEKMPIAVASGSATTSTASASQSTASHPSHAVPAPPRAPDAPSHSPADHALAGVRQDGSANADSTERSDVVVTTTVEVMPPAPLPSVSFIGDSVMYGARRELVELFPNSVSVDARQNRQFVAANRILEQQVELDRLGDIVVIHLGTNGPFRADNVDTVISTAAGAHRVILVTAKVPRRWEESVNRTISEAAERWPQVEVFDWHSIGEENPHWFYSDRVHLNGEGKIGYVRALMEFVGSGS